MFYISYISKHCIKRCLCWSDAFLREHQSSRSQPTSLPNGSAPARPSLYTPLLSVSCLSHVPSSRTKPAQTPFDSCWASLKPVGICLNTWFHSLADLSPSGMLPGISYYLSRWYTKDELAFRIAMYIVVSFSRVPSAQTNAHRLSFSAHLSLGLSVDCSLPVSSRSTALGRCTPGNKSSWSRVLSPPSSVLPPMS